MKISRHAALVIVFAGVIIVAVAVLIVFSFVTSQDRTVFTSFQECVQSDGAVILETYPEQCQARNGQTFVNPNQ